MVDDANQFGTKDIFKRKAWRLNTKIRRRGCWTMNWAVGLDQAASASFCHNHLETAVVYLPSRMTPVSHAALLFGRFSSLRDYQIMNEGKYNHSQLMDEYGF
jgi:hypothetical protein